ncbi:MAG: hypothetical protein KC983_09145 [Phycisphaerales bacterium]|nr:hypothetical protein [Phycisphaerales bacterium]
MLILCLAAGCQHAPKVHTTFLNDVDLVEMTDRMAQSFVNTPAIGSRTPTDAPWVVSLYRVVNHTNEVIPDREKWLYTGRLRAVLARSDVAEARSIIWIIPPERWQVVRQELPDQTEPYGLRMNPTHLLTAEFSALTNTSARGRSDDYLCSFQLVGLDDGAIIWEDAWEVKRAISGLTFD